MIDTTQHKGGYNKGAVVGGFRDLFVLLVLLKDERRQGRMALSTLIKIFPQN